MKQRQKQVDRSLYQVARDEVLRKLEIPKYFKDNIDSTIDLSMVERCLCPFHEEKTPSFRYNKSEGYWRCFGKCQDGGTVIELHGRKYNIRNHFDALHDLKERFGKKYKLEFRPFFLAENEINMSVEEILGQKSKIMSFEDFMKPPTETYGSILQKIDKELARLKGIGHTSYAEMCIKADNIIVYHIKDVEEIKPLLAELKSLN